jgi:hypothetical protein
MQSGERNTRDPNVSNNALADPAEPATVFYIDQSSGRESPKLVKS